jgi:hypothetical protein
MLFGFGKRSSGTVEPFRLGNWPSALAPELGMFLEYWMSKHRADGGLPARADIDPSEIPRLLPGIGLIDVIPVIGGDDRVFRYRLLGSIHNRMHGRDVAGLTVEEAHGEEEAETLRRPWMQVTQMRVPHYWRREMALARGPLAGTKLRYQRIVAPLAADGAEVDMLIGYWLFEGVDPV